MKISKIRREKEKKYRSIVRYFLPRLFNFMSRSLNRTLTNQVSPDNSVSIADIKHTIPKAELSASLLKAG